MSVKRPVFPATIWDGTSEDRSSRVVDQGSRVRDHDRIAAEVIAIEEYLLANPPSGQVIYSAEADSQFEIGTPIYINTTTGHANLAQAHNLTTSQVAGLSVKEVMATESAEYISEGRITKADWTAITGTASLATGQNYYLDPDNPGQMTTTAPVAVGEYVMPLGKAQSTTVFDIEIGPLVKL